MKKVLLFILFLFLLIGNPVKAQDLATCDLCGHCVPQIGPTTFPSSWGACANCLYEVIVPNPSVIPGNFDDTRKIQPGKLTPPTPYPKRQYTVFGCIKSDSSATDFVQEGPARSLSEKILSTVFALSGGIAFLYFLFGAFLLMTSQSEPGKLAQGKRVIYGAIVGLIFSLSAVFIIKVLAAGILKLPGVTNP